MRVESNQRGFTLLELLIALALGALLLASLGHVVGETNALRSEARARNATTGDARFALERMLRAIEAGERLLLPSEDRPATAGVDESIRDPGVLALTLDPARDLDGDGTPDADNDGDGRIDEDPPGDSNYDFSRGVMDIDDDADGIVDETLDDNDDDEDGTSDEDPLNGADDDGDGLTDEDPGADLNGDGAPGASGVDDDGDGTVDEGAAADDDEDGTSDEDWWDAVVFYLAGTDLVERIPVPWDVTGNGSVTGRDYIEQVIARNVATFRIARLPAADGGPPLLEITLDLVADDGEVHGFTVKARAGGGA